MYNTKNILKKEIFKGNLWKNIHWQALGFGGLSFLVIPLLSGAVLAFGLSNGLHYIIIGGLLAALAFVGAGIITARLSRPHAFWHVIAIDLLVALVTLYSRPDLMTDFNLFFHLQFVIPFLCFNLGALAVR